MSYDIFIQDIPHGIKSVREIPDDFTPASIGERFRVIDVIKELAPHANFSDPSWGIINVDSTYHIEVNLGESEVLDSFAFHVAGGREAMQLITQILKRLQLRGLDPQNDSGLFEEVL